LWIPRRFLRNLSAFSFAAILLFLFLNNLFGGLVAVAVLFFGPVFASAMIEGFCTADITGRAPDTASLWAASRDMTEGYLAFVVVVSLIVALWAPDFRYWLGHAALSTIFILYGAATLIAFVFIRWSYAGGVSLRLSQHNNAG
jgi:hypothetical protein